MLDEKKLSISWSLVENSAAALTEGLGYPGDMSALAKTREEALNLSKDERLELAADLVASIREEPDPKWEVALVAECSRRMESLESGQAQDVGWEEVEAELESELGIR